MTFSFQVLLLGPFILSIVHVHGWMCETEKITDAADACIARTGCDTFCKQDQQQHFGTFADFLHALDDLNLPGLHTMPLDEFLESEEFLEKEHELDYLDLESGDCNSFLEVACFANDCCPQCEAQLTAVYDCDFDVLDKEYRLSAFYSAFYDNSTDNLVFSSEEKQDEAFQLWVETHDPPGIPCAYQCHGNGDSGNDGSSSVSDSVNSIGSIGDSGDDVSDIVTGGINSSSTITLNGIRALWIGLGITVTMLSFTRY